MSHYQSNSKAPHSITIDLVPYDVYPDGRGFRIEEVGGSILAKLNNDPAVTGWRRSDEYSLSCIDEVAIEVTYSDDCLYIEKARGRSTKRLTFNRVVKWISENFDRIDSIGWEMLERA